jgi:hypothetical protein
VRPQHLARYREVSPADQAHSGNSMEGLRKGYVILITASLSVVVLLMSPL